MGKLLENLIQYFEETPKESLYNEWKGIQYLNNIGPDVIEYAESVKLYLNITSHSFDVKGNIDNDEISPNSKYYLAA